MYLNNPQGEMYYSDAEDGVQGEAGDEDYEPEEYEEEE
jgi:hypothetical protein